MFAHPFHRPVPSGLARPTPSFLKLFRLLLVLLALCAGSQAMAATTYYVRTDGGDATQCTGRADAPYPGSGTAQACAWAGPHYALPASGAARIAGGDTLIIGAGSYMIGWGAPGAAGGRCYEGGPYDCYLPPVPSGPSVTAKTRILGRGFDAGCATPPKFWGNNRVTKMLNLEGSSNVEIGCLEITDQSDCVEFHSNAAVRCARDTPPYGAWASIGLSANRSSNVWLHDLNIHGLANRGVMAGGLTNWTLDRVRINANGWAGWDGDIGSGSSNAGQIVMRRIEIGWNGCGERWQTGVIHSCWAQQGGGYGDGLGTAQTGGQWTIEDAYVHHNTSDGIDLLYLDGAANTSAVLRRVHAVANAGNQLKTRGATTIENSVVVGQCSYFNGKYNMVAGDHCRAQGNVLSVTLAAGQLATIRYNTLTGEGDCLILTEGGSTTSRVNIQNNALIGQTEFLSGGSELTCGHYANNSPAPVTYSGNAFWHVKQNQCPTGSLCSQDPKLTNMTLAAFDATPLGGSPLIDRAPLLSGVIQDFYLKPRPFGVAPDIGAIETQGSGPMLDFNGDGKSDILWRSGADASYWLMDGHAATLKAYAGTGGAGFQIANAGDYNGDGFADLVWASPTQLKFGINQAGRFTTGNVSYYGGGWELFASSDIDADGKSDLLWRQGSYLSFWLMDGATVKSTGFAGDGGAGFAVAAIGDFNGDGKGDVAWATSSSIKIWLNLGAGRFASGPVIVFDSRWKPVASSDVNGDGKSDLIWQSGSTIAYWLMNGAGVLGSTISGDAGAEYALVASADYNGDGVGDLAFSNGTQLKTWINNGSGVFSTGNIIYGGGWQPFDPAVTAR